MKNKNRPEGFESQDSKNIPSIYEVMDIVSTTECTGMLYKPPLTDEEISGYTSIFHMKQQKDQPSPTSQQNNEK